MTDVTVLGVIRRYAEAKSRADVGGALACCTDDVVVDTYAFQTSSTGKAATREQFEAFFAVFPDYSVHTERLLEDGEHAVGWGTVAATMASDFGDLPCTGRRFEVPFTCVWDTRDGLIARERFYFDLNHLCEQLGLSTEAVAARLHAVDDAA